ncbi:MAG: efflux RND transporter periplasmic adaptor subunit [Gemmatimonadaceae bacterium]|nr:efflux RND transporter periplasmic adaptor subunit [Gemmatimonadaceae bacterium]
MMCPLGRNSTPLLAIAVFVACGGDPREASKAVVRTADSSGTRYEVRDTTIVATLDAAGIAEPILQATLSTRLVGAVTAVIVKEGQSVTQGQELVRLDSKEIDAKRAQVQGAIAAAEAAHTEARQQAERIRRLFADSAAPRVQLEAAEAGLERARAALQAARAGEAELLAVSAYAVVRAPFDGIVTRRFVDAGALAAPGTPLVVVQDQRSLRVSVTASPSSVRSLARGSVVEVLVEGTVARGTIEGIVPAAVAGLLTINAVVPNPRGHLVAGGAATMRLPQGPRTVHLVPSASVRREGDLAGVNVVDGARAMTRWVRVGATYGDRVEVLSGLRVGETIVVPALGARE